MKKVKEMPNETSPEELRATIHRLRELLEKIPDLGDEVPSCAFSADGKKAMIELISPTLGESRHVDFFEEVGWIGVDNGPWYNPFIMEIWIKAFRDAAKMVEHNLKCYRSSPGEFKPITREDHAYCFNPKP